MGRLVLVFVLLVALLISLSNSLALYVDWLWFGEVGYQAVFTTILLTQALVGGLFGVVFFLVFFANVYLAGRHQRYWGTVDTLVLLRFAEPLRSHLGRIVGGVSGVLTLIAALGGSTHWESYLLFRQAVPFKQTDPLFGKDLGFYIFELLFLTYLQEWLVGLLLFATVGAGALYFLTHGIVIGPRTVHVERQARLHLGLLATVLIGAKAWGYQLDAYELLYSRRGVVFGAVYA
ncbi:MAG: hypothetical protein E6J42_10700, partial [Chloroflexi bacterium]